MSDGRTVILRSRNKRARGVKLFVALPSALFLGFLALFHSGEVLTLEDSGDSADVIVVPGGDGAPRAAHAARLWKEGRAPLVLVTGDGDCLFNRQILIREGVNPSAVFAECRSGSTWENALMSAPILRRMGAKTALIVTNWYHSRRAVASFSAVCPQMRFISAPVAEKDPWDPGHFATDTEILVKEYTKLGWYLLSGRIGGADIEQSIMYPDLCRPALNER